MLRNFINFAFTVILLFGMSGCNRGWPEQVIAGPDEIDQYLHIASPVWEDQVIYFIITDLFNDGDSTNNDQGAGEYEAGGEYTFNGGDLKGITQRLGYIKELGATAIWITPPVANQWWNPEKTLTGRHGYWATNFMEVDPHFGTLDDYRQLSASLHKNNMYLIQDVVVNHTGDFFTYTASYDPSDVTRNFHLRDVPQPTQYPFYHNDARKRYDRDLAVYHFTPAIVNYLDTATKRIYQFADLDDINTSNPLVRLVLRKSYNHWIGEVGVDGFRYDTPLYVEHDFWHDFIHSEDSATPGVVNYARMMGKEDFLNFGETGVTTMPFSDAGTREVAAYLGTEERPEMNSVMNYPLFGTIQRVFAEMQPTSLLTYRLESNREIFPHPERLINLIDDHNGERFLTRGSHSSFRQALIFLMTIPGIPVIYYGTEQDFSRGYRQAMFKGGLGSPDRDYFDTGSESFLFLQKLIDIRMENRVLTRGKLEVLGDSPSGPGIFAYKMKHGDDFAIVFLNTSGSRKLAYGIDAGLEPGSRLESAYTLSGEILQLVADRRGLLNTFLSPKEGVIFFSEDFRKASGKLPAGSIRIDPPEGTPVSGDQLKITGRASGVKAIEVIVDGDNRNGVRTTAGSDGRWGAEIPVHYLANGKHRVTAFSLEDGPLFVVSDPVEFDLALEAHLRASIDDPRGDDHGPRGNYRYPSYPTFDNQQDIVSVDLYTIGTGLKVELSMAEITRHWDPPNGFDHSLINIYIDLPGKEGVQVLPLQNARFPAGGHWDYLVSTSGYMNAFYSSEGATAGETGTLAGPAPSVSTDTLTRTITFLITAEALGFPATLSGTRIYINTWGGTPGLPRLLKTEPENWAFGGGTASDPRIMDETAIISFDDEKQ